MEKPRVAIVHRDHVPGTPGNYDEQSVQVVYAMLREALEAVGGVRSIIDDGDRVLVRANSCRLPSPIRGSPAIQDWSRP